MSVKSLEARLVISADDKTDGAFGSVAAKLRNLQRITQSAQSQMAAIRNTQSAQSQMAAIRNAQAARAQMDRVSRSPAATAGSAAALGTTAARVLPVAAAALGAAAATKRFAEVERAMTRIALTADATAAQAKQATNDVMKLALDSAMPFDSAAKGLEALVAQGRSLPEAMAFLPSVVKTAQAAGAETEDIAKSAGALSSHLGISADEMQTAFDTLVKGGNLGQFELKDMARYLPSLVPTAKALGMKGQDGLKRLVATLQVVREGSGTAEEAATRVRNIFQKMESDETVKNFKEMGVDLPAAMAKARASGQDLLTVFLDLTKTALKGDMSKIPRLFKDMEVSGGMTALVPGIAKLRELIAELKNVDGSSLKQFNRVMDDSKAKIDRLQTSWDRFLSKLGEAASPAVVPVLDEASKKLQEAIDDPGHREKRKKFQDGQPAHFAPGGPAYQERVAYLNKTIAAIDNRKYKPPGTVEKRSEFASELAILKAITSAYDETAAALKRLQDQGKLPSQTAIKRAESAAPGSFAPGYGALAFNTGGIGLGGASNNVGYIPPYSLPPTPANVPTPPTGRPDSSAILQKLDDVLGPGKIEAKVSGAADISVSVTASPLLVATVTQQVKQALVGWSLNSVGSTGRSAPDLDRRD